MHFVRSHVYSNAIDSYILIWPFSDDGDVGYHIDMNIVVIRMSNLGNGTSLKCLYVKNRKSEKKWKIIRIKKHEYLSRNTPVCIG